MKFYNVLSKHNIDYLNEQCFKNLQLSNPKSMEERINFPLCDCNFQERRSSSLETASQINIESSTFT